MVSEFDLGLSAQVKSSQLDNLRTIHPLESDRMVKVTLRENDISIHFRIESEEDYNNFAGIFKSPNEAYKIRWHISTRNDKP